jgi:hypothetical protein
VKLFPEISYTGLGSLVYWGIDNTNRQYQLQYMLADLGMVKVFSKKKNCDDSMKSMGLP